jgi:hypothetical protein
LVRQSEPVVRPIEFVLAKREEGILSPKPQPGRLERSRQGG